MPQITLTGVSKQFPGGVRAVEELNLTIPDGAFMCLLGPSGCGKTTILRMIAGLEQPSAGEISVGGRLVDSVARGCFVPPERRGMGLVFQSYALWPHLTVRENIEFGLIVRAVPRAERRVRVADMLRLLNIEPVADRYPSQISGGQQQRVALARMLVVKPQVLLLDEPLSNLDARLRLEMRTELKRIHQTLGSTIVFVTHDQIEAMTLGTLVAVMNAGRILQVDPPMHIYHLPAHRFVAEFVGNPPINIVPVRGDGAGELGASLLEFVRALVGPSADRIWSVGVRPEAIRLNAGAETGCWRQPAVIEAVLPTGPTWIVSARILDGVLFGTSFQNIDIGAASCSVSARDLHLFAEDGSRLELRAPSGARA